MHAILVMVMKRNEEVLIISEEVEAGLVHFTCAAVH